MNTVTPAATVRAEPRLQSALSWAQAGPATDLHLEHMGYGYRRRPVALVQALPVIAAQYSRQETEVGWQGLARFWGGMLLSGGALMTADGGLVADTLLNPRDASRIEKLQAQFGRAASRTPLVDAPAVVLTQGGPGNYGHWLADALPRLRWLNSGPAAGLPVYVHPRNLALAQRTAHLLPKPAPEFIAWPESPVRFRELWFPARCNHGPRDHCLQGLDWLREAAWKAHAPEKAGGSPPLGGSGQRLFISRDDSSTRQLLNDGDLWPRLQDLGFERVSCGGLSFENQVQRFADADCIVGIAGAALANLIFARPAARVLMLAPDCVPFLYYGDMVQHLSTPATFLFGPSANAELRNHSDFSVDLRHVQAWLDRALPESSVG